VAPKKVGAIVQVGGTATGEQANNEEASANIMRDMIKAAGEVGSNTYKGSKE
jgi:hypothetical protein